MNKEIGIMSYLGINISQAHNLLAITCLGYLAMGCALPLTPDERKYHTGKLALLKYAASNLPFHFNRSKHHIKDHLTEPPKFVLLIETMVVVLVEESAIDWEAKELLDILFSIQSKGYAEIILAYLNTLASNEVQEHKVAYEETD